MESKPLAKAVAQLDTICDEYAKAIRDGRVSFESGPPSLNSWLSRVPRDMRSWLREELLAISTELGPDAAGHKSTLASIDTEAWTAVNDCDTFQTLSMEAKLSLAKSLETREFDVGEVLLRSGHRPDGLFLITCGRVKVVGDDGNHRYEIATDGVGGVVGEMSLVTGYPCSADVIAIEPVRALVLPNDSINVLRSEHPELEVALSQLVSDRLGHRRLDALCGKVLGGYRLVQCIGNGVMGVVYEALDESDGSPQALKMLRHRFIYSPSVVTRFDHESELLARLEHPNIIALHGHFVAYRTRFIVLELFDGADLRSVLRRGPMSESLARAVVGQIAAGLQYAHSHGVLHLDLKPANVLIGQTGRVAITDFGLSRLIESDGCDLDCVGTPTYMPPEQFMMADIGPHCDWYALSCIAYELISGERLFQLDNSQQFMDDKLRKPSKSWPGTDASEEYCEFLRRGLEPMSHLRLLDLAQIASWGRPVPELATKHLASPKTADVDH